MFGVKRAKVAVGKSSRIKTIMATFEKHWTPIEGGLGLHLYSNNGAICMHSFYSNICVFIEIWLLKMRHALVRFYEIDSKIRLESF
jgi:hypothetical protein